MKTLVMLSLAFIPFSFVFGSQDMYQLERYEMSDLVLLETKKINKIWLACFKTPKQEIFTAKNKQFIGRYHDLISDINENGVELNGLLIVNEPATEAFWTQITYFVPIAKNNYEKDSCNWKRSGIQKVISPSEE